MKDKRTKAELLCELDHINDTVSRLRKEVVTLKEVSRSVTKDRDQYKSLQESAELKLSKVQSLANAAATVKYGQRAEADGHTYGYAQAAIDTTDQPEGLRFLRHIYEICN